MSTDNVFPIRKAPEQAGDDTINLYWDLAVALMHAQAELVKAESELETYTDCNGNQCFRPKGEGARIERENRQRNMLERERHLEHVRREVEALRLDEIDPDWRDHYPTQDTAAVFYRRELAEYVDWGGGKPKRVLGRVDRDVTFDDDLEDQP